MLHKGDGMDVFNGFRTDSLLDTDTSTIEDHAVQPMDSEPVEPAVDAYADSGVETDLDAAAGCDDDEDEDALPASNVFSLPSILLDSSAALQAAQRLYAASQSGLRFFSDFRRVVPTSQLRAEHREELLDDDDHDLDLVETH